MPKVLVISLWLLLPAALTAQRMGTAHFSGHGRGYFASGSSRGGYGRARAYGVPFLDSFYAGDLGSPDDSSALPPWARSLQGLPSLAVPPTPPPPPLMIELQGDRYVQISGNEVSPAQVIDRPAADPSNPGSVAVTKPAAQPQIAILVYRDGHRQEISAYTISNGMLYASADYYSSGAWSQTIPLSSLDLRETVGANQTRGFEFRLPSAANEVIVGP
jgi:hypothetical protein